jgi:2-oxoglutarate dehydrogenase E2 component (dihydrolipoamide succinyltransferase)
MKVDINVPQMGESITEAGIGAIFKPTGSYVNIDDEILELETDKVNQVIYAPAAGTITLEVATGDSVVIGQKIGEIEPGSEAVAPVEKKVPEPVKEVIKPAAGEKRTPMSRLRKTIADRLVQAKTETAMLTTFNEVDLTAVIALRDHYKETFQEKYGIKMGFMPFFVLATVSALKEYPLLNSHIDGAEIVEPAEINMGIAVATDKGLVVPVIRDVEKLHFWEIETAIASLAKKGREGTLTLDDIRGGTFTITNGGAFGSLLSTPILNFPQSGILGMHAIQKRAVVIGDAIEIRSMMYLALSYDHRLVDGREAVLFLKHIKGLLEDPSRFVIGV